MLLIIYDFEDLVQFSTTGKQDPHEGATLLSKKTFRSQFNQDPKTPSFVIATIYVDA